MNGRGKAGNGRGNNRKRPFRRWDKDGNTWQEGDFPLKGNNTSQKSDNSQDSDISHRNRNFHKGGNSGSHEKRNHGRTQENQNRQNRGLQKESPWREKAPFVDRPKWTPPVLDTTPLPVPDCPWCGKPIKDISSAIADKDTGVPVHFDCVAARIAEGEILEKGDIVSYIGGGRFGVLCFAKRDSQDKASGGAQNAGRMDWKTADSDHGQPARRGSLSEIYNFTIKKIIEWENKEKRADWRSGISDHYSIT